MLSWWITAEKENSSNGLAYFYDNKWYFVNEIGNHTISLSRVIVNDKNGVLWVLFRNDEKEYCIARKSGEEWQVFPYPDNYYHTSLSDKIFPDSSGNLWFQQLLKTHHLF